MLCLNSSNSEFRMNHKHSGDAISFNHTLAEILVEYASAVCFFLLMPGGSCVIDLLCYLRYHLIELSNL